eukprot:SM000195S05259  [mRNA]  locus=s195:3038:5010:- [translate_table: standard]
MKALQFAVTGHATDQVVPSFKRLDALAKEWQAGVEEQRALYLAVGTILRDTKGGLSIVLLYCTRSASKESFAYLVKYLGTYSANDPLHEVDAREEAVNAALDFIRAPDMFQCDLLELAPVRQLETDTKYAGVHHLLTIFLTGLLKDYLEFHAANPELIQSWGLVHEDCVVKMRLLSLTALANSAQHNEIPYSLIRQNLQLDDGDVEVWVVRAIAAKLIEAKMDQMREVAVIKYVALLLEEVTNTRHTQRVFGPAQWKELRSRLHHWKDTISSVSRTVKQAHGTLGQQAAAY